MMDPALLIIIALIPAPMILLLVWIIICELRRVPTFRDRAHPHDDGLDAFGRWMFGLVWLFLGAMAFWQGGLVGVFALVAFISVLAAIIAIFMTVAQSAKLASKPMGEDVQETDSSGPRETVLQRFVRNFRRMVVDVPISFMSYP